MSEAATSIDALEIENMIATIRGRFLQQILILPSLMKHDQDQNEKPLTVSTSN
jgi:hypothetical protein